MTTTAVTRCTVAGRPDGTPGPCVEVELPEELRATVLAMLAPFVAAGPAAPDDASCWRVCPTIGEPADDTGLTPYGGHDETAVRIGVDGPARVVRLVADPGSRYLPVHAVRVVRSLLRLATAAADPSALFVHGGLFARAGQGLAVLGGKRSGKTSTVLAALAAGAGFVSNDDLSLHTATGTVVGVGWPRSVSVREDTLAALDTSMPAGISHPANATFDAYRGQARLLFPAQLGELFGAPLVPSATVVGLVFPEWTSEGATAVVPLAPEQARERLRANLSYPPVKDELLAAHFDLGDPDRIAERADRIAGELPAFALRQSMSTVREAAAGLARIVDGQT